MKKSNHQAIRAILRKETDGLTLEKLVDEFCFIGKRINRNSLRNALSSMPDAYIDRWEGPNRGQYAAVWAVVVPPENCPKPSQE